MIGKKRERLKEPGSSSIFSNASFEKNACLNHAVASAATHNTERPLTDHRWSRNISHVTIDPFTALQVLGRIQLIPDWPETLP